MITENAEKIHQINGIKIGYTDKKIKNRTFDIFFEFVIKMCPRWMIYVRFSETFTILNLLLSVNSDST